MFSPLKAEKCGKQFEIVQHSQPMNNITRHWNIAAAFALLGVRSILESDDPTRAEIHENCCNLKKVIKLFREMICLKGQGKYSAAFPLLGRPRVQHCRLFACFVDS